MRNVFRVLVSVVFGLFLLTQTVPVQAGEVLNLCKQKEKNIRKLLASPSKKGTPAHQKKEDALRVTINELFDFEELGQRALVLHWDDITPPQQKEFLATLQSLIEKNYLLKITSKSTYDIKWLPELAKEGHTLAGFWIKSGKYKAQIGLRVIKKNGKNVVYDMLIDDVSLLENYRSQFNKIIRKSGFDELLAKMKRKLNTLSDDPGGKISNDTFEEDAPAAPAPEKKK